MEALVGQELGVSDWLVMTQERISTFAEASGDHLWIHVEFERYKADVQDGKTIAHDNLTIPGLRCRDHEHRLRQD